ncbi:HAAS signaling domain-containing protein [Microterricola viridarii]|uniref:Uncharacterized protein n=1 Tax=Microterricola viridarii TaxID=412690 RepID=A0A1H1NDV4_9MICO|nr:hypothetical protein [Microterricola viridarii]SDR97128.1 hypothetical protein SAMN04489834_0619 [Microterricola viridarii]
MTDARLPDARLPDARLADAATAYLARLDAALDGVDEGTAAEILAGVREELLGQDAAATGARIRELGDPEFIAAEARGALPGEPAASTPAAAPVSGPSPASADARPEPAWFAVLAGLLVMLGGVVVPVLGGLAGYVMVWLSTAWTRRQKLIATAVPVVYLAVLCAVAALVTGGAQPPATGAAGAGSSEAGAAANPLLPAGYDVLWSGVLLLAVVQLGVGAWLLAAARRTRMRRAG